MGGSRQFPELSCFPLFQLPLFVGLTDSRDFQRLRAVGKEQNINRGAFPRPEGVKMPHKGELFPPSHLLSLNQEKKKVLISQST